MIYTIEYSKEADKTLRKWKKSNPQLFKKALPRVSAKALKTKASIGLRTVWIAMTTKCHTDTPDPIVTH